jgi:hypothetical protein
LSRQCRWGENSHAAAWNRRLSVDHVATLSGGADLLYVCVTQSDGHQAWSSPIYLIA